MLITTPVLGALIGAFSVSHIGLSAVRETLIEQLGGAAGRLGAVGRGATLPSFWPADTAGREVWPDEATAGRQLYRAGYTLVSSALLFPALGAYPQLHSTEAAAAAAAPAVALAGAQWWAVFAVAAAAQGFSIASLAQPSPLSLVPGFEADASAPGGVKRDDARKLRPAGLTRVTRHPLILPVVPWGVANALLAGGGAADRCVFLGLAAYALAGCRAQDLRVEASNQVGTVFDDGALAEFYRGTSFVPFGAVADGRQRLEDAAREVPRGALAAGLACGVAVEWATLEFWVGVHVDLPLTSL